MESYFKSNPCPICSSVEKKKSFDFKYSNNLVLEKINAPLPYPVVSIWQCLKCSHKYSSPIVSPIKLNEYYSKINSEFYRSDNNDLNDPLEREHLAVYNEVSKNTNKGSILEIGCGKGFLLNKFAKNDWDTHGVEPSPLASAFAKEQLGLNVKQEFLTTETYPPHHFDVIMLFDVVEHLTSMDEMIQLIKHYLKPEGLLVFGTANIDSLNAKINGKTWSYFGSWEHVSFFSPKSIKYLLNENGLSLEKIIKHSHRGSDFENITNFLKNVLFFKPINIFLPTAFKLFPFLKTLPGVANRSMAKTAIVTSRLAFDHFTIYSKFK